MGLFECVYYYYYYFNYEINSKIDFFGLVGSILVSSESLKICSYDIRLAFFLFIYLLYIEISFPAQDELPELDQAKFSYKSLIFLTRGLPFPIHPNKVFLFIFPLCN
jgi:hypothetical protein